MDQDERIAFRGYLADMLSRECSSEGLHERLDKPERRGRLEELLAESGWFGLLIPEALGGLGLAEGVLADAYVELGKALSPVHLLPTQLAVKALLVSLSQELQQQYLPRMATGELHGAVTSPERSADIRAEVVGDIVRLNGSTNFVLEGAKAGVLIVKVDAGVEGSAWVLVDTETDAVTASPQAAVDQTREFALLEFSNTDVPGSRLLAGRSADITETLVNHAALSVACDSLGAAERILEITVEYMKIRTQFDRPIGSFQALKHRVASHKVNIEALIGLVSHAAEHIGSGSKSSYWASMAKFTACDTFKAVAADAVQLHGGIGFSWEHVCHLYLKRAKLNQHLFGDGRHHKLRSSRYSPFLESEVI